MATMKVAVIDYGIGNVFSVLQALERLGVQSNLTHDRSQILSADRVILPGVGAFGRAAKKLKEIGLDETIHEFVATGKSFLGICVGMQLLLEHGEEFGTHQGLGIIPGTVRKITSCDKDGDHNRVPLIGWMPVVKAHPMAWETTPFSNSPGQNAYYFIHSYQAEVTNLDHRIATHRFGNTEITSAVRKDNVLGVQFHPERSAAAGQAFLANFLNADMVS